MGSPDRRGQLVRPDRKALRAKQDRLAHKDPKAIRDLLDHPVIQTRSHTPML